MTAATARALIAKARKTPEFDIGKWMDLSMMALTTGRERTAAEFRGLLERDGFGLEQIVATPSPLSIVIGRPIM